MIRRIVLLVGCVVVVSSGRAIQPDPDLELLRQAKVRRDNQSLIALLDRLAADEKLIARRDEFIRQLSSPKFKERDEAAKALIAMRSAAVEPLKKAVASGDAEARRSAKRCLDQIQKDNPPGLPLAAVRVLLKRNAAGALQALLRDLPSAQDYEVEEEICFGLDNLTEKAKTASPALVKALTDSHPAPSDRGLYRRASRNRRSV